MQAEQIVALLMEERDRLSRAIDALLGPANSRGKTPATARAKKSPPKRRLSAAGRKAIAKAAKRRWAAVKAGKAQTASAKASK
ncbi:MAG TPA: hypothetical protein VMG40_09520 [Bryobacteraceae bacterium]|nr:hypothetical protein [Bryobacteraceae bacterium]